VVSVRKNGLIGLLFLITAAQAGCYPATIYKPVAAGVAPASTPCAGRGGYLFVDRNGLRFAFHTTEESGKFYVYISVQKPLSPVPAKIEPPVQMNLSEFVVMDESTLERFKPIAFDRLESHGSVLVRKTVFPVDPAFTFNAKSADVRIGFSGEVADRDHLFLLIPKLVIDEQSVQLPGIEFIKTTELRGPALDCEPQ